MELGQHTSQKYDEVLEDVRGKVLRMGGLVEQQTALALRALLEREKGLARKAIETDDKVNAMEVDIDEECITIIARHQPTARDLRLLVSITKVITDLERVGDEATKIGRYARKLAKKTMVVDMHSELSHLGQLVQNILHDALDAFARLDLEQAIRLLGEDQQINREFDNLTRLMVTHMMEDPRSIKSALRIIWCGRSLERIGDHAQNIAEHLIYLIKGKDVRHTSLEHIRTKYFPHDEDDDEEEPRADA